MVRNTLHLCGSGFLGFNFFFLRRWRLQSICLVLAAPLASGRGLVVTWPFCAALDVRLDTEVGVLETGLHEG